MLVSLRQRKINRAYLDRVEFLRPGHLLTILVILASTVSCLPASPEDKREKLVDRVFHQLYTEAYDSVLTTCAEIGKLWPDDPMASILQMSVYQTQMRAYRVRIYEAQFDSVVAHAVELADHQARKNPTAEMLFMQGSAWGMQALHHFKQGKWSKGLKEAVLALHYMKKSLQKDQSFADPKLSLGLYNFWKGEKLNFGLGFGKRGSKQALKLIEDVWKRGRYLWIDAAFTLQNILLHADDYARALEINEWLLERFPGHPSVLYHRALLFEKLKRPTEALSSWLALIERIQSYPVQSNGYLAECYLHCAQIYEASESSDIEAGSCEKMKNALKKAAFHAEHRDATMELESSFQKFDEIHDAIKKMQKRYANLILRRGYELRGS